MHGTPTVQAVQEDQSLHLLWKHTRVISGPLASRCPAEKRHFRHVASRTNPIHYNQDVLSGLIGSHQSGFPSWRFVHFLRARGPTVTENVHDVDSETAFGQIGCQRS